MSKTKKKGPARVLVLKIEVDIDDQQDRWGQAYVSTTDPTDKTHTEKVRTYDTLAEAMERVFHHMLRAHVEVIVDMHGASGRVGNA